MSPDEASIICGAVDDADTWGCGRISEAKKRIEEAGYVWTEAHELFIFREFAE
jgi:hypothetical protein